MIFQEELLEDAFVLIKYEESKVTCFVTDLLMPAESV